MFDFEKLEVYKIAQNVVVKVLKLIKENPGMDEVLVKQLKRSSTSVLLNLAEGTGRMTNKDKQHFYTIARGSVFESVSIVNLFKELNMIREEDYQSIYNDFESCSKMLLALYRSKN
ncbi:MAG: four helix bundle protein [Bacteroidetes bacterium]|nr:four helix bundle protein [Bacteroidota bacterium]